MIRQRCRIVSVCCVLWNLSVLCFDGASWSCYCPPAAVGEPQRMTSGRPTGASPFLDDCAGCACLTVALKQLDGPDLQSKARIGILTDVVYTLLTPLLDTSSPSH